MHKPPKETRKLAIIALIYIFKLTIDKYFNPCVISSNPYINFKSLFILKILSIKPVIIKQKVIIPIINNKVFAVLIIDSFNIVINDLLL